MRFFNDRRMVFLMYLAAVGLMLIFPSWASAHESAEHSVSGFSAGMLHPLTGLDHLLMLVAVACFSVKARHWSGKYFPVCFLLALTIGFFIGQNNSGVRFVEGGITLSLLLMAALLISVRELPSWASFLVLSVFGLLHGIPHGMEMPLSAPTEAYFTGMTLSTISVMSLSLYIAKRSISKSRVGGGVAFALVVVSLVG